MNHLITASEIIFKKPLTLYFKPNAKQTFELKNFQTIAIITNLKQFWNVYNNIDFEKYLTVGCFFLCNKSPIWNNNGSAYSFIVNFATANQLKKKPEDLKMNMPWLDLSLAFLSLILNNETETIFKKVEGISIRMKDRTFNLKLGVSSSTFEEELIEEFKKNVPSHFNNYKFMANGARKNQFVTSNQPPPRYPNLKYHKKKNHAIKKK